MTSREIYPAAPIALVVAEIKHSWAPVSSAAEWQLLKDAVSEVAPIRRTEDSVEVDLQSGEQKRTTLTRFVSRDQHISVAFRPDAIVVETTAYPGWERYREIIVLAIQAREDVSPLDGLERVGLRYIDEIRVPNSEPLDWSQWVASSLLGPVELAPTNASIQQQRGILILSGEGTETTTINYGAGKGQVVTSSPNLRRISEDNGPFFLIDIDGAWAPDGGVVPEFDAAEVMETLDRLHGPIDGIFEALITNRLRTEVLRNAN